jgi:hypothetical protein
MITNGFSFLSSVCSRTEKPQPASRLPAGFYSPRQRGLPFPRPSRDAGNLYNLNSKRKLDHVSRQPQ